MRDAGVCCGVGFSGNAILLLPIYKYDPYPVPYPGTETAPDAVTTFTSPANNPCKKHIPVIRMESAQKRRFTKKLEAQLLKL